MLPFSTPQQAPPAFSVEDEIRRLEELRKTPTYSKGGKFSTKSIKPESVDFLKDQAARYGSNYRKFKFGETPEGVSQEVFSAMNAVSKHTNPMVKGEFLQTFDRADRAIEWNKKARKKVIGFPKGGKFSVPTSGRGAGAYIDVKQYPQGYPYSAAHLNTPLYTDISHDSDISPIEQYRN